MTLYKSAASVLLVLCAAALMSWKTVSPWQCNVEVKSLRVRSQMVMTTTSGLNVVRTAQENLVRAERCIGRIPGRVDMHMIAAANAQMLGKPIAAAAHYAAALKIDRRPELYLALGSTELELGQRSSGLKHLVRARQFTQYMQSDVPEDVRSEVDAIVLEYEATIRRRASEPIQ